MKDDIDTTPGIPYERAQNDLIESALDEVRGFSDWRRSPDLVAVVMQRVARLHQPVPPPHSRWRQLVSVLWTTQQVSFAFRPAYALLGSALLLVALSAPWARRPEIPSPPTTPQLFVQFRLQETDASTVQLAGSFTNWQPAYALHETAPGIWTITIPLSPGVHDYAFVVDGQHWMPDPYAAAVDDGFGGTNSRIALVAPEDSRL